MSTSVIARIDVENNAEEFWNGFRREMAQLDPHSGLYATCREIVKNDCVEMSDPKLIEEFDTFVNSIAGFANGPEHAPTAIVFESN